MSDIVDRLRRWVYAVDAVPASDLMDEAASEIERLRADQTGSDSRLVALTGEERETIEWAVRAMRPECRAVLQGLPEQMK